MTTLTALPTLDYENLDDAGEAHRRIARARASAPSQARSDPVPSVSVADVTTTPWAGFITDSAKGCVGRIGKACGKQTVFCCWKDGNGPNITR